MASTSSSEEKKKALFVWPVAPIERENLVSLSSFFKSFFKGQFVYGDMDLFTWKIWCNPFGQGFVKSISVDNEIAATTSIVPKRLWYKQRPVVVAEIGDSYTKPQHLRKGMFAAVSGSAREEAMKAGIDYIYGLPNDLALPGWEKYSNFKRSAAAKVYLLQTPLYILKILSRKTHSLILATMLMTLWTPLIVLIWRYKQKFLFREYKVETVEDISPEMSNVFEKAKSRFDYIFDRSLASLKWRYEDAPANYRFYLAKKNGETVGYLIGRFVFDEDAPRAVIADYLSITGAENSIKALCSRFANDGLKLGCEKLELWCSQKSPYFTQFRSLGLKAHSREVPVIAYQNPMGIEINQAQGVHHFTIGDSDNI